MSAKRDGFGRIKRTADNRDYRRAHLQGAFRLVVSGQRKPESFTGRIGAAIRRLFA